MRTVIFGGFTLLVASITLSDSVQAAQEQESQSWLAGDHHIHSRFSVGWNRELDPPSPILGGDAIYPIPMNGLMARHFGLAWTVATDHGGPNHSKVNHDIAYPELQQSRELLPDLIQFFGMELNPPGADHSSLIIPHSHDEADQLRQLESRFDRNEPWPANNERNNQSMMLEALRVMNEMAKKPLVIANHPSRSASGQGEYGLDDPAELRGWNDIAPEVAIGMEGAPGHQAAVLSSRETALPRGYYNGYPTLGGFDQMTAIVGGFWDSMLSEGRHWWITANSDSHTHYSEGGIDFWPGEYSKTYVYADRNHDSIMDGLRHGRVFVTLGDLISEMSVEVSAAGEKANIGGELKVDPATEMVITIKVRDPEGMNHNDENPQVNRIDLIMGKVSGAVEDKNTGSNRDTQVIKRFSSDDWQRDGEYLTISHSMTIPGAVYFRVRGTNSDELEPEEDVAGEDPWQDLWFYSNPVFISLD